jgi:hypothetical protein
MCHQARHGAEFKRGASFLFEVELPWAHFLSQFRYFGMLHSRRCLFDPFPLTYVFAQSDCVAAVMHKYVDAQKLIVGRYSRQQAAQQSLN